MDIPVKNLFSISPMGHMKHGYLMNGWEDGNKITRNQKMAELKKYLSYLYIIILGAIIAEIEKIVGEGK